MIDLILIQLIIVFIIDISGITNEIKRMIWKWLKGKDKPYVPFSIKPFDCSLCMTFWVGLIFLIVTKSFTIPMIAYVCLLSWLTVYVKDSLYLIGDFFQMIINKLSEVLN